MIEFTVRLTGAEAAALAAEDVFLTRRGGIKGTKPLASAERKLRRALLAARRAANPAAYPAVEHVIAEETIDAPFSGTWWRIRCSCGFQSGTLFNQWQLTEARDRHLEDNRDIQHG